MAFICMSPVLVAKALEGKGRAAQITVGTTKDKSPYDIAAINAGIESTGASPKMCPVSDFIFDEKNKIITTPAYMMDTGILEVADGIAKTVKKLFSVIS